MEMKLKAKPRELKEKMDAKSIPAVIYGPGTENKNLKIDSVSFDKIFAAAGESTLIDLEIEGDVTEKVIIKSIQKNPIKDFIIHADFYKVDMNQKINADVHLEFIGESKAVKEQGAILVKSLDAVSITCLPSNLIDRLEIDLGKLENMGDSLKLSDLVLPEGVELTSEDLSINIASAVEPKVEAEPVVEEVVAVEGEEKKEGEETKEGEEKKEEK